MKPGLRLSIAQLEVRTLVRAGHETLPEVAERLAGIGRFRGTEHEGWAVQQAYALMPTANFSRSILGPAPSFLAVSELPGVTWSDLGNPRRVLQSGASLSTPRNPHRGMPARWERKVVSRTGPVTSWRRVPAPFW